LYCLDCKKNNSEFASITFGVFICGECAKIHQQEVGRNNSFVKSLYHESWDEYQLKFLQPGIGGNKAYYEFLKQYSLEHEGNLTFKYTNKAAQYYQLKVRSMVDGKQLEIEPPSLGS
jgi:hypothetical protein